MQASGLGALARGQAARLAELSAEGKFVVDEQAATAISDCIREATDANDWRNATLLIKVLATSPDLPAREVLRGAVADARVPLRPHVANSLVEWTRDRSLPELAEAARSRLIHKLGSEDRSGAAEWMRVVAAQGDQDDIDWLVRLVDDPATAPAAIAALTSSRNPLVIPSVHKLMLAGRVPSSKLSTFAEFAPEGAFALISMLLEPGAGETRSRCRVTTEDLMSALGQCTSASSLARTRDLLLGITDVELRLEAPLAVQRMRLKGLDVSAGFEPIIEAPLEFLKNSTAETPPVVLLTAASVVQRVELTWSERTANALDQAAAVTSDMAARNELQKVAQSVRSRQR